MFPRDGPSRLCGRRDAARRGGRELRPLAHARVAPAGAGLAAKLPGQGTSLVCKRATTVKTPRFQSGLALATPGRSQGSAPPRSQAPAARRVVRRPRAARTARRAGRQRQAILALVGDQTRRCAVSRQLISGPTGDDSGSMQGVLRRAPTALDSGVRWVFASPHTPAGDAVSAPTLGRAPPGLRLGTSHDGTGTTP
jgi:hypothetical protein